MRVPVHTSFSFPLVASVRGANNPLDLIICYFALWRFCHRKYSLKKPGSAQFFEKLSKPDGQAIPSRHFHSHHSNQNASHLQHTSFVEIHPFGRYPASSQSRSPVTFAVSPLTIILIFVGPQVVVAENKGVLLRAPDLLMLLAFVGIEKAGRNLIDRTLHRFCRTPREEFCQSIVDALHSLTPACE